MNKFSWRPVVVVALACTVAVAARAVPEPADADSWDAPARPAHAHSDNNAVGIGQDMQLRKGERADAVVSIVGSSTADGDAQEVVSILGDTWVTGSVAESAVAVLGNTRIDGHVAGDAVAVLGNVELGPQAVVDGDVVAVLGVVKRDPAAEVHGSTQAILASDFGGFRGLRAWVRNCLFYARPLALTAGLGWAWSLAGAFLALYVVIALLWPAAVERCVLTLERQPGRALLAALLCILLTPLAIVVLCITVLGIALIPFFNAALLCVALFGKAVLLAWVGRRLLAGRTSGVVAQPAVAVIAGGVLVTAVYLVPVLGFLAFTLVALLGFGAVVVTLVQASQDRQAARAAQATAEPAASAPSAEAPAAAAPAAAAPAEVPAALPRAGFWIRMGALVLDILLVGVVLSALHHSSELHLIALAAYGAVMWKLRGATVGGIIFDLKVVRVDGREMDWETAIIRALGCFLSLVAAGLGFIWIAFDPNGQAWHDKIAGTLVVRVPKRIAVVEPPGG